MPRDKNKDLVYPLCLVLYVRYWNKNMMMMWKRENDQLEKNIFIFHLQRFPDFPPSALLITTHRIVTFFRAPSSDFSTQQPLVWLRVQWRAQQANGASPVVPALSVNLMAERGSQDHQQLSNGPTYLTTIGSISCRRNKRSANSWCHVMSQQ